MAVYHGARRRGVLLPGGLALPGLASRRRSMVPDPDPETEAGERGRSARRTARTDTRPRLAPRRRVGSLIAGIVIVFGIAFISLSQSVRVAATSYDVVRLASERDRLDAVKQDLRSDLVRLGGEPAIRKLAIDQGLGQLGAPLTLSAR